MKIKNVVNNIYLEQSIVYELLTSMFYINCKDRFFADNPKKKKYISKQTIEWLDDIDNQLDDNLRHELAIFFDIDSFFAFGLIPLIFKYHVYEDIDKFLEYFRSNVDANEIFISFFRNGYAAEGISQISTKTSLETFDIIKKMTLPEHEKWKLTYFYHDQEGTKDKLLTLIADFYHQYFKRHVKSIRKKQIEDLNQLKELFSINPKSVYANFLMIDKTIFKDDENIILFPMHYYGVLLTTSGFENNLLALGGMDRLKITEIDNEKDTLETWKVISDTKRIKIIQLLNQGDYYGYEIGQRLGLSNSTISHHLSLLTSHKIIESIRHENKIYYTVNKDNIREVLERVKALLTT